MNYATVAPDSCEERGIPKHWFFEASASMLTPYLLLLPSMGAQKVTVSEPMTFRVQKNQRAFLTEVSSSKCTCGMLFYSNKIENLEDLHPQGDIGSNSSSALPPSPS